MKRFKYLGGPAQTGVTLKDGTSLLMHKGKDYDLDETSEYVQTLLAKRNANGMPSPWLMEVESDVPESPQEEESETTTDDSTEEDEFNDVRTTNSATKQPTKKGKK